MIPSNIAIRQARLGDADAILALAELNDADHGGELTGHLRGEAVIETIQRIPCIVACERQAGIQGSPPVLIESLAGFLLAWEKAPSNPPFIRAMLDAYSGGENSYVYGPICVAAEARGRGIAGAMYEELRRLLPGREGILFIKKSNEPSLRAHRKMGMREAAEYSFEGTEFIVFAYK